jgi:membrane-bound lytic murein transglycosylase A
MRRVRRLPAPGAPPEFSVRMILRPGPPNDQHKQCERNAHFSEMMAPMIRSFATLLVATLLVAGCAGLGERADCPKCPEPPKPPPTEARYDEKNLAELPGWALAQLEPSVRAFVNGCPRLERVPALARVCAVARSLPAGDEASARAFFEGAFVPYSVVSPEGSDEGQVTGYYEPILAGSRSASVNNRFPVFGVPEDLVIVDLASIQPELRNMRLRGRLDGRRLVPYYTRAEIESRARTISDNHRAPAPAGNPAQPPSNGGAPPANPERARDTAPGAPPLPAPVLAWVADPVELFFLQIQGSGQVELDSGERIRLGYADQNGHPYRSLGRWLVERGELALEQASMQGIKAWAALNPAKLDEALNSNASYVFFRELPPIDGPIGALGAPLSAGYSIAVDRRHVPLGAPVYLATTWPLSDEVLERLMVAQDTGGAIRGAVRVDFFWGTGPDAGALAGRMRQRGRVWILWPRGEPLPRPL